MSTWRGLGTVAGRAPAVLPSQVGGGDRQPVHLTALRRRPGQGRQGGGDVQVRGHRARRLPGPQHQVGDHLGAQQPDGAGVAVGLEHPRRRADRGVAGRGDVGGQVGDQPGHALLRGGLHPHVGAPFGLLAAAVPGVGVELEEQQLDRPLRQLPRGRAGGQPGGPGQQPRLHPPRQHRVGVLQDLDEDPGPVLVQLPGRQRRPGARQRLAQRPGALGELGCGEAAAGEHHRRLVGEELRHPRQLGSGFPDRAPGAPGGGRRHRGSPRPRPRTSSAAFCCRVSAATGGRDTLAGCSTSQPASARSTRDARVTTSCTTPDPRTGYDTNAAPSSTDAVRC